MRRQGAPDAAIAAGISAADPCPGAGPVAGPVFHTAAGSYLDELGLTRSPFPPTPDADAYFHTASLEDDLAEAAHCLLSRKGFVLMTGEVGMGKSTFVRRLLDTVERQGVVASLVFNTFLQGPELLAAILRDFSLEPGGDAADNINRLNGFLVRRWQADTTCVLIIDDAQNLSLESLELLRLLSNLESGQEKLLQIVLAGQPELEERLGRHEIRQLTSRIVKHIRMGELDASETARYVEFRLMQAGASGRIRLDAGAHVALYRNSRGNPRRIHLIMDRCLYGVVALGNRAIGAALVRQAAAEAGFHAPRRPRRWPIAAALAVVTGLATAAGIAWGPGQRPADLPPGAPVTAAAARTSATLSIPEFAGHGDAGIEWRDCLSRLSSSASDLQGADGAVQLAMIAGHHVESLRQRGNVCLRHRDGRWTAAWRPRLQSTQLFPGSRGGDVRVLQAMLLARGAFAIETVSTSATPETQAAEDRFDPADTNPVDGVLGPRTRDALARFQHRHRLPANGDADPLTLLLLDPASAPGARASLTSTEFPHGRG